MSNVSPYAEHLIRAAIKGIEADPESWDQEKWVAKKPECGTTYCLGGWMMLYDGWKHSDSGSRITWFKGEHSIEDPYTGFLAGLVYGDAAKYIASTIFTDDLRTFTDLVDRIEGQLEINFEEDCPCLYETLCNLGGCPCGTHKLPIPTVPDSTIEEIALIDIITRFVKACRKDGDTTTVREVLEDERIMTALRDCFQAGAQSVVAEVTAKADRRVAEINTELQQLRASTPPDLAPWERDIVLRKLQGQVDELRDGTRRTPEFRKMKAALRNAQSDIFRETNARKRTEELLVGLRATIDRQERTILGLRQGDRDPTKARQEGFRKAVESWQKALDIIKAQENL